MAPVASRREIGFGLALALGILAVVVALGVVPPPWLGWFR
jgi:hypothetical protein